MPIRPSHGAGTPVTTLRSLSLTGTMSPAVKPVQRVEYGSNILKQVLPGRQIIRVMNMTDEGLDGNKQTHKFGADPAYHRFNPYDARAAACLPDGSVCAVRQSFASQAEMNIRYLRDIGIAGDVRVGALPEHKRELPLMQLAHENSARLQFLLGALGTAPTLLPYIGSTNTNELAEQLGLVSTSPNVQAVEDWSNKGLTAQRFEEAGIAVPPGTWLSEGFQSVDVLETAFHKLRGEHPEKSIFALIRASSGAGVFEIEPDASKSAAQLSTVLGHQNVQWQLATPGLGVRLAVEVPADLEINWMAWIADDPSEHRFIAASRQIMLKTNPTDRRATAHAGNIALEPHYWSAALQNVDRAVHVMWKSGLRGFVGVDELVDLRAGLSRVIEVNPRMNGNNAGGFPALAVGPLESWAAHNKVVVPTGLSMHQYIAHLQRRGAHYDKNAGYGVFVVNAATAVNGAMQIGIRASNTEHTESLLQRAKWVN